MTFLDSVQTDGQEISRPHFENNAVTMETHVWALFLYVDPKRFSSDPHPAWQRGTRRLAVRLSFLAWKGPGLAPGNRAGPFLRYRARAQGWMRSLGFIRKPQRGFDRRLGRESRTDRPAPDQTRGPERTSACGIRADTLTAESQARTELVLSCWLGGRRPPRRLPIGHQTRAPLKSHLPKQQHLEK